MNENKILINGLEAPNRDRQIRWLKAATLGLFSVLFFALTWHLLNIGLASTHFFEFWFWTSVTGALGVTFLAFLSMLDLSKIIFWATNLLILGTYLLILPKDIYVVTGGMMFLLFIWLFERRIREDEHSRADFSATRIFRSGSHLMIYGLLFLLGFNIYSYVFADYQKNPEAIYDKIGYYTARGLHYIPSSFGNLDPNQTVDQFVANEAKQQDPTFNTANKFVQDQIIEELKKQIAARYNLVITGNPLLGDVIAGAVSDQVERVAKSYSSWFPFLFTLFVIISLRSIAFLFIWLTEFMCWMMYHLLRLVKFFKIKRVQVEVDKLDI